MAEFSYKETVEQLKKSFHSGRTKSIEWRRRQLEALVRLLDEKKDLLCDAMKQDLNKARTESMAMEVSFAKNECITLLNNLDEWAGPQPVKKNVLTMMDTCYIKPEPLGVALIMGAWNYPVQLTFVPLAGAIAAGNCVVLKPSELSENTAKLIEKIIPEYVDQDCVKVINGGIPETTALLKERFDHIFYTGNSHVGKIVMEAASKHLTPVTLELGGKSPCYVDGSSDLDVVAQRVMWGKFTNCGQTCIAPDYLMCSPDVKDKLLPKMKSAALKFWGENPKTSPDFGRLVNTRHFNRVKKFLDNGDTFIGGETDEKEKYIAPTILHNVKATDLCMQEEIFGPVLPVITMDDVSQAIQFINSREKPLALYIFSKDEQQVQTLLDNTTSGSTCVNDALSQVTLDTLPFGGVGNSGTGAYHGKFTFDTFCHKRGVMIKKQALEAVNNLRYPPYSKKKDEWLDFLLKKTRKRKGIMSFLPMIMLGVVLAFVFRMLGLQNYLPKSLTN